jgi:hypothetical protein
MKYTKKSSLLLMAAIAISTAFTSCQKEDWQPLKDAIEDAGNSGGSNTGTPTPTSSAILLVIDEESIDNGNAPNNFSATDVNDQIANVGQRSTLRYFNTNIGKSINLYSGEVGDEAWHALKSIPDNWKSAGPTNNGAQNFLKAGPGLGGGNDDREVLLDKIPNITPLRASGLKMLIGQTVLAVVYDGDISINYGPLNGNLQGANLGLVALKVEAVTKRTDGSSGSLPIIKVKIMNVESVKSAPLKLFSNAPAPRSSSEPYDITPPATVAAISLTNAP